MNGHNRPTVDNATWFDIQVRCLEQLRILLMYLDGDDRKMPGSRSTLAAAADTLMQVLIQSMDHNARQQ